jgi:hypothetical protein
MYFGFPGTLFGGFGVQAIIWGIIALIILFFVVRKQKGKSVAEITRTVYINIFLDIFYMIAGLLVILFFLQDIYMVGNGIGVIVQGFFLLVLDLYYYTSLKKLE